MPHAALAEHHPADTLRAVIAEQLSPLVRAIDAEGLYPQEAMAALGAAGAFGHHGDAAGLPAAVEAMAAVGQECGSTAFCLWCQDALGWYLALSDNAALKADLLPRVASGALLGGTGLSNPVKALSGFDDRMGLSGDRVAGGWRVSGRLPWVSNLGRDHRFASIFRSEHGPVMAMFDCAQHGVTLGSAAPFIALEGTRTFPVLVRDAFVSDAMVLAEDAAAFVGCIRQGFVLLQMGMAIGVARAAATQMRRDASARSVLAALPLDPDAIDARAEALMDRVHERARKALDPSRTAFLATLALRLDGSRLALEAAQANIIAHGARGYLKGSDAERLQREAHFVAIVTPSVKHILTELQRG